MPTSATTTPTATAIARAVRIERSGRRIAFLRTMVENRIQKDLTGTAYRRWGSNHDEVTPRRF